MSPATPRRNRIIYNAWMLDPSLEKPSAPIKSLTRPEELQAMSTKRAIKVSLLKQTELEEAHHIVRLAFGTFLGMPDPLEFMGDRNLIAQTFARPTSRCWRHATMAD